LGSDFEIIIPVSSAWMIGLARPAIVFGRSFIYSIKNKRTKDGALGNAISSGFPFWVTSFRFISYDDFMMGNAISSGFPFWVISFRFINYIYFLNKRKVVYILYLRFHTNSVLTIVCHDQHNQKLFIKSQKTPPTNNLSFSDISTSFIS
jgi:hypothetical protein